MSTKTNRLAELATNQRKWIYLTELAGFAISALAMVLIILGDMSGLSEAKQISFKLALGVFALICVVFITRWMRVSEGFE